MKTEPLCFPLTRRSFIARTALAASGLALARTQTVPAGAADQTIPPIVVFSKIYQTLKLDFEEAAALTAEAGLAGIDCPVRDGGEVSPARVAEELPRYAEALKKRNLKIHLLTSGITEVGSPHAEKVLTEAKKLGVRYYRLGFMSLKPDVAEEKQLDEIKAKFKELGTLNAKIGVVGMLQNHSPGGRNYVGGELGQMYRIVKDLDPAQIGVAFDIGHALAVHGREWRPYFEKLKPHLKVAYIKDRKLGGGWVPFGEGEIARTDYFKMLKQLNYSAPFSLHIEFGWDANGKTRSALLSALKQSVSTLASWAST